MPSRSLKWNEKIVKFHTVTDKAKIFNITNLKNIILEVNVFFLT